MTPVLYGGVEVYQLKRVCYGSSIEILVESPNSVYLNAVGTIEFP
jgi:hypothetical protein